MAARLRLVCAVGAGLLTFARSPSARAEDLTGAAGSVEAKRLFSQGSALYLAGQYEKALETLQQSHTLVPSPNSELVIARCLRELGRPIEAKEMFESAEAEARRRAADGAAKYAQTAESAAAEGAAVRASLGTLRIRVEGPDPTTKVAVDGAPADIPPGGEVVVWHSPGEAAVSMRSASGLEQRQVVTVRAGAEVTIGFGRQDPPPAEPGPPIAAPPAAPPLESSPRPVDRATDAHATHAAWAFPAAVVSGGVTLAGAGLATGFGISANAEYHKVQTTCVTKGGCGPGDRSLANAGKAYQVVEYVSLGVASVAAAATATFAVIAITHPSRPKTTSQTQWRLLVGATTLGVGCDFP